jgi:hypothetical protein
LLDQADSQSSNPNPPATPSDWKRVSELSLTFILSYTKSSDILFQSKGVPISEAPIWFLEEVVKCSILLACKEKVNGATVQDGQTGQAHMAQAYYPVSLYRVPTQTLTFF